jgi:hypothetical protein
MVEQVSPIPEAPIAAIRYVSSYLGNRAIDTVIPSLGDEDYRPWIVQFGGDLEMIYTVFLRIIYRASQVLDGSPANAPDI